MKKYNKSLTSIKKAITSLKKLQPEQKAIYKDFICRYLNIYDLRTLRRSSSRELKQFVLEHYNNLFKIQNGLETDLAKIYDIPLSIIEKEFGEASITDVENPYTEEFEIVAQEFLLFHKQLALLSPITYIRTLVTLLIEKEKHYARPNTK